MEKKCQGAVDLDILVISYINDGILAGKTPMTINRQRYAIKLLLDYLKLQFLPITTVSVTKESLERFIVYGINIRKWKKITQWTMHQKLSSFFNWCVKKDYLSSNPMLDIPKPKVVSQPPKALNEQEILFVLREVSAIKSKYHFINLRNKAIVATFLFTGLRKSELLNLRYEDVDLNNGFIFVKNGKGGKDREVPIEPSTLMPVLEEYVDYRNMLGRAYTYFFTGSWAGSKENNRLSVSNLDKLFRYLSEKCKKRIHAHKLRHSFATMLLDRTGDIYTLKELMGHSNISTTCIYLSSTRRKKVEAISTLKLSQ